MPFVQGFLRIRSGAHPDHELPSGEHPSNELPGSQPGIDNELPMPPPGVWPPPVPSHPIVPAPPNTPPGAIWPPATPARPDQGLPSGGGHPDQGLPPTSGGSPSHPISGVPSKFWIVAGIPGYGWRYVCVDPSLRPDQGLPMPPTGGGHPDQGLPGGGNRPDQGLPPTAQPKR